MSPSLWDVTLHLLAALAAGAFIGTERSFHGRFAGFRTHTLVCLTSSTGPPFKLSWMRFGFERRRTRMKATQSLPPAGACQWSR